MLLKPRYECTNSTLTWICELGCIGLSSLGPFYLPCFVSFDRFGREETRDFDVCTLCVWCKKSRTDVLEDEI